MSWESFWDKIRKKRRDKAGGFSFIRRHEDSLRRKGYRVKEEAVGSIINADPEPGEKGSLTIYRDKRVRIHKHTKRPDKFSFRKDSENDE
jgi:hypothetical protein